MRSRSLLSLFLTLLLAGCAKIIVVPASGPTPAEGMIYALPNTVVRIQLKIDQTKRSGAIYSPFASIFVPDGEAVCKDEKCTGEGNITFALQQGPAFSTYGEPDPENVFLVKFTGRGPQDQTMSMSWSEAGLLSSMSSSVTNRAGDVALSGLKSIASLAMKWAFGAPDATKAVMVCRRAASITDDWVIPILQKQGPPSSTILLENYCSIDKQERDKFTKDEKLLTDAVSAYVNNINPLAAARSKILGGTSQTFEPAAQLSLIEAEIGRQFTALYLGIKKTSTWDGALDVRTLTRGIPIPILRINDSKGFCPTASEVPPSSKPVPKEWLLSDGDCGAAAAVNLTLEYYPDPNHQLFNKISDIKTGDRSFRYRIPAQVRAQVSDAKKTYGDGVFSVAQFGTVISLPADRHSKMLSYDLGFIEATGALKTFKLGATSGLDSATVDALANVGGTLVDARNTSRKNEDELAVLTKQYMLLKLMDDICTIQKKYGLPCSVQPD